MARVAVEPARAPVVLDVVEHAAERAELHRGAIAIGDDQRCGTSSAFVSWPFACSVYAVACPSSTPVGRFDVLRVDRRRDFVDADLAIGERRRVELDAHGVLLRAEHLHLRPRRSIVESRCAIIVSPTSSSCGERERRAT